MPINLVFGCNIYAGKNLFINSNCTFQDYAAIKIGDNVWFGPNVVVATIRHPLLPAERNVKTTPNSLQSGSRGNFEQAAPVIIGNNVVIYSSSVICPGVVIGDNTIIGAGSVVTRDIPPNVLAYGTPCKVIREITEADRIELL